ncbi:MAG TPA: hypothetical protein VLB46_10630 [Pyrinomonadaceae bacterium]|nr:hypothetical protein [Pyrinomonadaceae bacterium]
MALDGRVLLLNQTYEPLGTVSVASTTINPQKAFRLTQNANPFRVAIELDFSIPGLSLRSNPGLKLANAFGVTWA